MCPRQRVSALFLDLLIVEGPFGRAIEPYIPSGAVSVPGRYAKAVDSLSANADWRLALTEEVPT
jgi:hypothetical protein